MEERIDTYLLKKIQPNFPNISRSFIQNNIDKIVTVNGKTVKQSYKIKKTDNVKINQKKIEELLLTAKDTEIIIPQKGSLDILYEDSNCLVLNKPKGIPVQPGANNRDNTLANYVKNYLIEKKEYDSQINRAGIVHRLDKPVSGIILFAKTRISQKYYQEQFENHTVQKLYKAKVDGIGELTNLEEGRTIEQEIIKLENNNYKCDNTWYKIEGYIGRNKYNRKKMFFSKFQSKTNKYALTYVKPLDNNVLLIKIETGRMHQIRASLKYLNLHIIGDTLYADKTGSKGIPEKIELESIYLKLKNIDNKELKIKHC